MPELDHMAPSDVLTGSDGAVKDRIAHSVMFVRA
jgi:hypothetical protein